jgi:hypothetical protein
MVLVVRGLTRKGNSHERPYTNTPAVSLGSYGWTFLPTVGLAAVAAVIALVLLPESKTPEDRPFDWPGQITATIAIAATIFCVIEGGAKDWSAPETIAGLCIGAAGFLACRGRFRGGEYRAAPRSPCPLMAVGPCPRPGTGSRRVSRAGSGHVRWAGPVVRPAGGA